MNGRRPGRPARLEEQGARHAKGYTGVDRRVDGRGRSGLGAGTAPIVAAGGVPPAVMAGDVIQTQGPAPMIMPPLSVGPPNDPLGLGPTDSNGPPPGPMWPPPGPYGAPLFQPPPPGEGGYGGIPRFEFWGGYTLWFNKNQGTPYPLLSTSAPGQGGVPGASSTLILAGGTPVNYGVISGLQLGASFYGDDERRFGMLVNGFYTGNNTSTSKWSMTGNGPNGDGSLGIPVLARPFIDTTYGGTALVVSGPGIGPASAIVTTSSQTWGVSNSAIWNVYRSAPGEKWYVSTDFLLGYRFTELRETYAVSTDTSVNAMTSTPVFSTSPTTGFPVLSGIMTTPVVVPVGGVIVTSPGQVAIQDRFTTANLFNGTTVGFRNEMRYGMFSLDTIAQIGLGDMHQVLEISGYTYVENTTTPTRIGAVGTAYGGLLANASNIGRYAHDDFAVLPEVTANVGVNLTQSLTAYVGFNFMYMNHVIRPGDQMNPVVDSTSIPLSANYGASGSVPAGRNLMVQTDYWLMGVNFGSRLEILKYLKD